MAKIILLLTYVLLGSCADAWSAAYARDNNGNTLSVTSPPGTQTLGWDYEDRLVSYGDSQTTSTYEYDPDGIKRGATVNGIQTKYLLDHNQVFTQVLEERDSTNALQAAYTFGNDLLAQVRAGTTSNYLYDALGSVRALSDTNGSVSDSYVYEAFGTLASQTGATPNSYLYTGEQYEAESGLYKLRARRYQPGVGRFLSRDTFNNQSDYTREVNRYAYGLNNPAIYSDPSGNSALLESSFLKSNIALQQTASLVAVASATVCSFTFAQSALSDNVTTVLDILEANGIKVDSLIWGIYVKALDHCQFNRMRPQLQYSRKNGTTPNTLSSVVLNTPDIGVTVKQLQGALFSLNQAASAWTPFTNSKRPWLKTCIIKASQWAQQQPPSGVIGDHKNVYRCNEQVNSKRIPGWRLDIENIHGLNLTKF